MSLINCSDISKGDTFTFGSYGGKDIEWLVLDVQGGKALVISKGIIDMRAYNVVSTTWEQCDLRQWLNNDFYNQAFSSAERSRIAKTYMPNPDNPHYGTDGGNDTQDYVFLLSIDEAERYFSSYSARVAYYDERTCWWWLRSPGRYVNFAAFVGDDGGVYTNGAFVNHVYYDRGVRPALWVELDKNAVDAAEAEAATAMEESKQTNIGDVSVGDKVYFGSYDDKALQWRVLAVEDGKALLITEDIIERKPYNDEWDEDEGVTWESCTLRKWLNENFLSAAFSSEQQQQIKLTNLDNPDNPHYGTDGGNDTQDYIFLLSIDEAQRYFSSDSARVAYYYRWADWWWWWLRSPGSNSRLAAYVNRDGYVDTYGDRVGGNHGVRPALWVELGKEV
jgi:co-chaperonin GroES (HSP10)